MKIIRVHSHHEDTATSHAHGSKAKGCAWQDAAASGRISAWVDKSIKSGTGCTWAADPCDGCMLCCGTICAVVDIVHIRRFCRLLCFHSADALKSAVWGGNEVG